MRHCCRPDLVWTAILGLACVTGFVHTAHAQLTESALTGIVVDGSGQAIASCSVVARHDGTGQTRTTETDRNGSFNLAGLPPGAYSVTAVADGFQPVVHDGLRLTVGQTIDVTIQLGVVALQETVAVTGSSLRVAISTEPRLADTFSRSEIHDLPLPQRDVFLLPKLSAGATEIPGAASSTKLSSSPVVTVHGNRYRGNNYVLDGAMNTNPNNTGEPAIVPSVESVDEVQVQTQNFAAEFGRGNGAVINIQTRSGSNALRGRAWDYHRNAALNARNYFAASTPPQVFHQFGANLGGPLRRDRTFFFGSYEGTRNTIGRAYTFQVETPELRDYVQRTAPDSVAARLLRAFPAPAPLAGVNGARYVDQRDLDTPSGRIPASGRAAVTLPDSVRFDQ